MPTTLVETCHQFQVAQLPSPGTTFTLDEFPTLAELEAAFRTTKAHRSVGLDSTPAGVFRSFAPGLARFFFDAVMKEFTWGTEPIQHKGGPIAVIPKKLDWTVARNFRGIMLLPTVSKRIHSLLREKILPLLAPVRPPGQIGGFRHQQTPFGSLAVRSLTRTLASAGHSVAVLFIDLSEAFHRLVRELVTGVVNDDNAKRIIAQVEGTGISAAGLRQWLTVPGLLQRLGCKPALLRLLQDVHHHTWFCLQNQPIPSQTLRGTRPGSPLADTIFHVLMVDCLIEINTWIAADEAYSAILANLNISFDTICWADDLAIPWATSTAEALSPAILSLLRFVQQTFNRKGMTLNMARGKTSVVAHYNGPGAASERARLQLATNGGEWFPSGDASSTQRTWLHYVSAYKHLGTVFCSSHSLDKEIRTRIGQARSAFQLVSKPLLSNRRIPLTMRVRLFRALILSKLFFGSGAWSPLSNTTLKCLRTALASMLKSVLGTQEDGELHHATTPSLYLRAEVLDPAAYIALERLRLAESIYKHGWDDLQHLLDIEQRHIPTSWLAGLQGAVEWYNAVVLPADEIPTELPDLISYWRTSTTNWKRNLLKLAKRHLHQERLLEQARTYHRKFFRILTDAGARFAPDPFAAPDCDLPHECPCGRTFTTGQGLAVHKRKVHGIFSQERPFLQGATCPQCMRYFWTTQRLQQHLAYIPKKLGYNPCFNSLQASGYSTTYEAVNRPRHVVGLHRVEAMQEEGPLPLRATEADHRKQQWRNELDQLCAEDDLVPIPVNPAVASATLFADWTATTLRWFDEFQQNQYDPLRIALLPDLWVDSFVDYTEVDTWLQDTFLSWGHDALPGILSHWEDGEAEPLVENAFYKLTVEFPRFQRSTRIAELRRLLATTDDGPPEAPQPHRAARFVGPVSGPSTRTTYPGVKRSFGDQKRWHDAFRPIEWSHQPNVPPLPIYRQLQAKPQILIAHLFSGRRRSDDFHAHLNMWAEANACNVVVLSLDTAVSSFYGNLHHESISWKRFLELLQSGCISGALTGSPCETFSAARFHPPPLDSPEGTRWPRPLRSHDALFGLEKLRAKEMRQLEQGTLFFFQVVEVLCWLLRLGGCFIAEHPATPHQPDYPSIWRSAIVQVLLRNGNCKLERVQQYRWGCAVRKPTGLLHCNLPFFTKSLYEHALSIPPPAAVAIGKNGDQFQTAKHKEYPPLFGKALAFTLGDGILSALRRRGCSVAPVPKDDTMEWLSEVVATSAVLHEASSFLPDFQGW